MKKLIQILLVLVVTVTLVFGLLQFTAGSSPAVGGNTSCRVGWNSRTGTCLAGLIRLPGDGYMPNVGWNSQVSVAPSQDLQLAYCIFRICTNVGWNS
jgi:hypothetical protein